MRILKDISFLVGLILGKNPIKMPNLLLEFTYNG